MFGNQPFGQVELGAPDSISPSTTNVLPGYTGLCLAGQPLWKSPNSAQRHSVKSVNCYSRIQSANKPPHTTIVNFKGLAAIRRRQNYYLT
jgi:hypothetical protein